MKKSGIITLALVTSLALFGCNKKKEKQPDEWTVQTDTENREVVQSYHSGISSNPFFWYWIMSRSGNGYGYYGNRFARNTRFAEEGYHFGSHSLSGGKSFKAGTAHIARGGFGHSTGKISA